MGFLSSAENIPLLAAALFAVLWYVTSPDSNYETVEMERISTKRAFGTIGLVCFALWLALLRVA
jgi:hypothetical protein